MQEANRLRNSGRRICEVTKFAIEHVVKSRRLLASLFHVVFIYAYRIHGCTDFLIEINPRHVAFYKKMLGFEDWGDTKVCPRVSAPARLLRLDLSYMRKMIQLLGGHGEGIPGEKSLYPYFFSPEEEDGITGRLMPTH